MRLALFLGALTLAAAVAAAPPKKPPAKKPASKPAAKPVKPTPRPPQDLRLGPVSGKLPGDWAAVAPEGQFRVGQYAIPKPAGEGVQSHLLIFHFGAGGGGTVEDNVRRWYGMMQQPDGGDSAAAAKRALIEREGLKVTHVDLPGTYQDRPFPRSEQVTPRPGYRMLAAIIETTRPGTDGPYYLRLVGPAGTVAAARPGWDAFLASLKAD